MWLLRDWRPTPPSDRTGLLGGWGAGRATGRTATFTPFWFLMSSWLYLPPNNALASSAGHRVPPLSTSSNARLGS